MLNTNRIEEGVYFRMPAELYEKVKLMALARRCTMKAVLNQAVAEYLGWALPGKGDDDDQG